MIITVFDIFGYREPCQATGCTCVSILWPPQRCALIKPFKAWIRLHYVYFDAKQIIPAQVWRLQVVCAIDHSCPNWTQKCSHALIFLHYWYWYYISAIQRGYFRALCGYQGRRGMGVKRPSSEVLVLGLMRVLDHCMFNIGTYSSVRRDLLSGLRTLGF